jgi:hypothetical protein
MGVCTFVALAGIGYVWAKNEVYALGKEIKKLENRLDELKHCNKGMKEEYATMCTYKELGPKVKALGLAAPAPDQIVRLPEPTLKGPIERDGRIFAAQIE